MLKKEPLIFMGAIALVGYGVFHGHEAGKDCWICPYRGIIFAGSSMVLGAWLAVQEE